MRNSRRRLGKLARAIEARPIPFEVLDAAFRRFRETGELPENLHLARAVVERTLLWTKPIRADLYEAIRKLKDLADAAQAGEELPPKPPDLRRLLLLEAVSDHEFVRRIARIVIETIIGMGRDVLDPEFVPTDVPAPEYGTVGLYLLGWPEFIVKAPYEEQAKRLLQRLALLRGCVAKRDERWYEEAAATWVRFVRGGELPGDPLLREYVLVDCELTALTAHYCGRGQPEAITAFDRVALAEGAEREEAMAGLQDLVRAGGFLARCN